VEENKEKFDVNVKLRTQTSTGRSSRTSWPAHICVASSLKVQIIGGWRAFATDNRLKRGDYVLFLLREDARSEFVVHFFRGPRGAPYFPDQEEEERRSDDNGDEEEEENESESDSESEKEEENTNNQHAGKDQNAAPLQHTGNLRVHPRFTKRLTASNIGRPTGELNTAQFVSNFICAT